MGFLAFLPKDVWDFHLEMWNLEHGKYCHQKWDLKPQTLTYLNDFTEICAWPSRYTWFALDHDLIFYLYLSAKGWPWMEPSISQSGFVQILIQRPLFFCDAFTNYIEHSLSSKSIHKKLHPENKSFKTACVIAFATAPATKSTEELSSK